MKAKEVRDMSDEQLRVQLEESVQDYFKLRIQAQTERLDAPSELRRHRRLIARIKTIQRERQIKKEAAQKAAESKAAEAKPAK